jgi:hypothetical protein
MGGPVNGNGAIVTAFVSGLIVAGYLAAVLFFLRGWRDTRDRLFGIFAAAFVMLAVQRTALTVLVPSEGVSIALYALRAGAFVLIIWAIVDKNRGGR